MIIVFTRPLPILCQPPSTAVSSSLFPSWTRSLNILFTTPRPTPALYHLLINFWWDARSRENVNDRVPSAQGDPSRKGPTGARLTRTLPFFYSDRREAGTSPPFPYYHLPVSPPSRASLRAQGEREVVVARKRRGSPNKREKGEDRNFVFYKSIIF